MTYGCGGGVGATEVMTGGATGAGGGMSGGGTYGSGACTLGGSTIRFGGGGGGGGGGALISSMIVAVSGFLITSTALRASPVSRAQMTITCTATTNTIPIACFVGSLFCRA